MKKIQQLFAILIIFLLVGCNLQLSGQSTQEPINSGTQAAMTVQAELTRIVGQATLTPSNMPATSTTAPTNTTAATVTNTPIPCNKASFVTDVTIPDGTSIPAGGAFTKTWRLRNIGSCTWNSSYQLVFYSGDPMGPSLGYAQSLTSGYVSPGQTVDATVSLTAPLTAGTYTGYWGFRDPGGVRYSSFLVKIVVPPAVSHTITVNSVASEGGSVRSDGTVLIGVPNGGDSVTNAGAEIFVSFDISGIPTNATITQVAMDLSGGDLLGSPFAHLGCMKAYQQNFIVPLIPGNYVPGPAPAGEDHDWCSVSDLTSPQPDNDFKNELQAKLGASNRIQYRFQFATVTNGDGLEDMVRLPSPVKLVVTYTTP